MGNGNKVEFLVAVCALIASAMAVYMAWDQGRVMRAQQHGAVFPVLQVDGFLNNDSTSSSVGITIHNSGVGPALIESVALLVDNEPTNGFSDQMRSIPAGYQLDWSGIVGRALAPGATVTPIKMVWPLGTLDTDDVRNISTDTQAWRLEICYCSVFGRCWKTSQIGRSRATVAKTCERQERDIFEELGLQNLSSNPDIIPAQEASE